VKTSPSIKTALPGPLATEVLARDKAVTSPSLPRAYPLVPQRGRGASVEDVDGNVFLDFNAGIAVSSTGHSHPKVVEAVRRQAGEMLHYSASDFRREHRRPHRRGAADGERRRPRPHGAAARS
jgi:4-aminobutyrate aminotransferase